MMQHNIKTLNLKRENGSFRHKNGQIDEEASCLFRESASWILSVSEEQFEKSNSQLPLI